MHFILIRIFFILVLCCSCSGHDSTKNQEKSSYLRMATADDPLSLDPRLVRDLNTATIMHMLFEGLMTPSSKGKNVPAIAETYTISEDKKTYTFHLRKSFWSDGSPVVAEDFVETWKSILSPTFPAPNAYQLYLIKGAKAAKEGTASAEEIGIKAPDHSTLIVELEQPASYFLEMVSCHFFFPVHKSMRTQSENQANTVVSNGPFKLEKWIQRSELRLAKNPEYRNAEKVDLDGISLQVLDEHTALQLFKAGELDWAGSPLSTLPQDAIAALKRQNMLQIIPGNGTHWFRLNTSKHPFNEKKIRRAFALALNRQAIVEHVTQGNQLPAIGIVPPSFGISNQNYYRDDNVSEAKRLFNQSLIDAGISKASFPTIAINYTSNDRNHKIAQAVQQQWVQAFGINIVLNNNELHMQLDKIKTGNYDISMGSWYADIEDPINFLEVFKSKDNPTNQTYWEDETYSALLDRSSHELDPENRRGILAEAEKILIEQMPVIPLFHSAYNYLKRDGLEGDYLPLTNRGSAP